MALIFNALKTKFPSIYELLLNNQKEKNLIFFAPNNKLYTKEYLDDKSFYYNHIFQKSQFDPSLYINLFGKVLKCDNGKTYKTYLGWTLPMTINVIDEGYTEGDGLFFFQTDGICIEKDSKAEIIKERQSIPLRKFNKSSEYLKYYSEFDKKEFKNFQRGIKSMKSFVFSILNNYLLLKGYEEDFANVLHDKINNFVTAFEIIFRDKSSIAREFVDSYIFSLIYEKIMEKIDIFYLEEKALLKKKLDENIHKYGIIELNLDSSLSNCKFEDAFEKIDDLKNNKTSFEKMQCLFEIYNSMTNEFKIEYEKNNNKSFEIQDGILKGCWTYILTNYIHIKDAGNIYNEYLFFKYFCINKGYEAYNYILTSFITSVEVLEKELLNKNKTPKIELIKCSSLD